MAAHASATAIEDPRLTREQTSRSALELENEWDSEWTPTRFTSAPPPLDGFEQRWVRCRLGGADDVQNFLKRTQQGWKPRPLDTLPKAYLGLKQNLDAKFGDQGSVIGNQDCILMHRPRRIGETMRAHQREQTQRLSESIRDFVQGQMPRQRGTLGGLVERLVMETHTGTGISPPTRAA